MDKKAFLSLKCQIRCSHQLQECSDQKPNSKETSFHGHHMDVIVTVKGPIDENSGLILSRDLFANILQSKVIAKYDKSCLNDFLEFPTGERLAEQITTELVDSEIGNFLHQVQIKETEKNFFSGPICNE